jgi:DNA helicase-2/ATP-dependent DNA helicase PcrA
MDLLSDLNPAQRDAVTYTEEPLLILAGAGSGKTRVLTHRLAYLIKTKKAQPQNILAITFTNKAAEEMRVRVEQLLGKQARGTWIMTFHALCVRILRKEAERLGFRKNFSIFDEADSKRLIKTCLKELDYDPKRFTPPGVQAAISLAKNELVSPEEYKKAAFSPYEKVVAEVYRLYQTKLYQNNAMDFDDLLVLTVNLFELFPAVLETYQERFKYILIDEYQDTNYAQYRLVKMLAEKHQNICVVGDDDQSIYRWRGANLRNILDFEKDFPNAKIVRLEQNYRSTQIILDAANYVISHNRGRKPKSLWTANAQGEAITAYQGESEQDEAVYVASEIERLIEMENRTYKDFAVFYRTHAQSRVLEEAFMRHGIPYKIVGGLRFYERAEIKDILAYLRALINPDDTLSLKRVINVPRRGIGKTSLAALEWFCQKEQVTFFEGLKRADENSRLTPSAKQKIGELIKVLDELKEVQSELSVSQWLKEVAVKTGYWEWLKKEKTIEAESRLENLQEFYQVAREFEVNYPNQGIENFLERISLLTDIDTYDESEEAVTLMTLHNAKGLEFSVVFMVGLEEGVFPHIRSLNDMEELEEERRLCYVGITRAKERLYLTYASSRRVWGARSYAVPSRFLQEIPESLIEGTGIAPSRPLAKPSIGLRLGEKVKHRIFGIGQVVKVESPDQVTISFPNLGEKTFLLEYTPLEKISP